MPIRSSYGYPAGAQNTRNHVFLNIEPKGTDCEWHSKCTLCQAHYALPETGIIKALCWLLLFFISNYRLYTKGLVTNYGDWGGGGATKRERGGGGT